MSSYMVPKTGANGDPVSSRLAGWQRARRITQSQAPTHTYPIHSLSDSRLGRTEATGLSYHRLLIKHPVSIWHSFYPDPAPESRSDNLQWRYTVQCSGHQLEAPLNILIDITTCLAFIRRESTKNTHSKPYPFPSTCSVRARIQTN